MPDTGEIIQEQQIQNPEQQVDDKAELAQLMQIALNNGRVAPDAIVSEQELPVGNILAPVEIVAEPVITFDTLKEKFAYEKAEDAIKEIEELRAFKANPVQEIEFANEESKKYFELIKAGKMDEAYEIQSKQRELDRFTTAEVNKDNAGDIIKLGMKYKYKDLTPSEIDYKYKKQFSHPKEPVQTVTETDEEFEERKSEWKGIVTDIEMDKILEAKLIRPELEAYKQKLILPDIDSQVDDDYVQWKKQQEENKTSNDAIVKSYEGFKDPKVIETKLNFNDEANKIAFEVQYQPTGEDLKKAVDMASDINLFFNHFIRQDGSPDREGFLRALHIATNPDKVFTSIINQAKNGTIKASLPNNSGGVIRQLPQQQEVSELDAQMQRALGNVGRR